MTKENNYTAADLSAHEINELKSFEEKISQQANKEVVVIAYEKGGERL